MRFSAPSEMSSSRLKSLRLFGLWYCGRNNGPFSRTSTDLPAFARMCATGAPPAPLPMTMTSKVPCIILYRFPGAGEAPCRPPRLAQIIRVHTERWFHAEAPVEQRLRLLPRRCGRSDIPFRKIGPARRTSITAIFWMAERASNNVPAQQIKKKLRTRILAIIPSGDLVCSHFVIKIEINLAAHVLRFHIRVPLTQNTIDNTKAFFVTDQMMALFAGEYVMNVIHLAYRIVHTISVVVEAFLSGAVEIIVESIEKVGRIGCLKRQDLSRKTIQDGHFPRLHFKRRRETVGKKPRPALPVILEF